MITVTSTTLPATKADTTNTESASTYVQEEHTHTTDAASLTGVKTAASQSDTVLLQVGPTSSTKTATDATTSNADNVGLQLGPTYFQSSELEPLAASSKYLVSEHTRTPDMTQFGSQSPSTVVGIQETDGPSKDTLSPAVTTIMQEGTAGETPSVMVVQETKKWAPSKTRIEQKTTGSDGQSTVQIVETVLPSSTSVSQPTIIASLGAHQGYVAIIQQTETWQSSETTIESTTTNADGITIVQTLTTTSPYLQLCNNALPAERSILLSPPTNANYGVYSAICQRHLFLGVLSFTTILGEIILPVTLSHVPFSLTETCKTQIVCAWLSIAILGLMIPVLASSFLVDWPHMPVDPRTVVGAVFYICDSWMLETLQGMSTMEKKERDLDMRCVRLRYRYGLISGAISGKKRMGVDVCDDTGEAAVVMRREKMQYK